MTIEIKNISLPIHSTIIACINIIKMKKRLNLNPVSPNFWEKFIIVGESIMNRFSYCFMLSLFVFSAMQAQNLHDDLKMKKGEFCIALNLSQGSWSRYWEGSTLIENKNIGTFIRKLVNPMIGIGISDKLNLFADIPYVMTEASDGQMRGVNGIQDEGS